MGTCHKQKPRLRTAAAILAITTSAALASKETSDLFVGMKHRERARRRDRLASTGDFSKLRGTRRRGAELGQYGASAPAELAGHELRGMLDIATRGGRARSSPELAVSVAMRFHAPCSIIAASSPHSGARNLIRRSADRAATPSPIPVIAVNSGCAKPVSTIRAMKSWMTAWAPDAGPYCSAPDA